MKSHLSKAAGALALAATLLIAPGCAAHSNADTAVGAGPAGQGVASAGGPAGTGGSPQARGRMGQILMSLNLTDDQKAKIKQIMAETRKENETVTDRAVRRANYRASFERVQAVLTPEQQAQFKAKMAAMRAQQTPNPDQTPQ